METENNQFNVISKVTTKCGIEKITVDKCCFKKYISHLKNSAEFEANILHSVMACDTGDFIELNYNLYSEKLNRYIIVAVLTDKNNPVCDTVTDLYRSAGFDEREIFDMFGVYFEGHKNLSRILMPNSAVGNPLRKDYIFKDERSLHYETDL